MRQSLKEDEEEDILGKKSFKGLDNYLQSPFSRLKCEKSNILLVLIKRFK
jgi:hypothetical protein